MVCPVADSPDGKSSHALVNGWLAAIIESSDDAIVSKKPDGTITSWNPAAQKLFGYTPDEVIGRSISILAPPDRENEIPAILARIGRGEKVPRYETVRRRKDGSLVEVSLTVSPIFEPTGGIIGASKIARDITERKRAERALRESEERFRTLANTVPDIIWVANPDGTMTFLNDRGLRFCGIAREHNAGQWPELAMHPDDRERCVEQWARALREGTDYEVEVRHRRHDGEYRWFLTRATPVRGEGQITAWFGSTTDIHDRRQAEEQQRRLTSELSHRVKNMLSVVQVLAARSGAKAASVAECIEVFHGRLQALSAAHSALVAGHWNWVSLARLVQTTLAPYLAESDRIRLDVKDLQLDSEIALTLAIGLHELATNAAKYGALSSPTGRITLMGRVETGQDGDELHLLWQEDGGPKVEPPTAAGFGTTMLTQAIQYQHKGRAELDWRKEGLVYRIVLLLETAAGPLDSTP